MYSFFLPQNYNRRHRACARIRRSAADNTTPSIDIGLAVLLLVICRQRMAPVSDRSEQFP